MQIFARVFDALAVRTNDRSCETDPVNPVMTLNRNVKRKAIAAIVAIIAFPSSFLAGPAFGQRPLQIEADTASPLPITPLAQAIETGAAFELDRAWNEAIRHYESATREFPSNRQLYQRLIVSRLHFDVNRRYNDQSFVGSSKRLTPEQTLDLYTEILANLETHYVESVDWNRVLLHGTAALEIALTEDSFVGSALPKADPDALHQFQQTIHQRIGNRPANSRFDLRGTVAFVAATAKAEIGLSPTAVLLEYVSGAVSTLDPYTRLLSGDQLDEMFSNIEGNFVGLGVELETKDSWLRIVSVIPGGPAQEAGIQAGERIVRVENSHTERHDPEIAADLLRGPEKTYVSLTVESRDGQRRELNVQRRRVDVPCVENVHLVDAANRIGYLRLTNFQKTTTREIEAALWDLQRQGMRALVMDVRGNPGGLLSAAVEVADRFLANGRIVTTRGRNTRENFDYVAHRPNTWDIPLAVLIDNDSASASEIFAGAIADSGRGVLVGQQSYGKGSVQGIFRMQSAKFGLCLTTAKFYSPSGKAISQNGVSPDHLVDTKHIAARPADDGHLILDTEDSALQKAMETLASRGPMISKRK